MAIFLKQIDEKFRKKILEFEEKIDSELVYLAMRQHNPNEIVVSAPEGMEVRHFEVLRLMYKKAGWKDVELEDERPNERFIRFLN